MTRELRFNCGGDSRNDIPVLTPDTGTAIVCTFESPSRLLAVIPNTVTGAATLRYQQGQKSFRVILPPINQQGQWEAGDPKCLPPEYQGDADKVALHYGPVVMARPTWDGTYLRHADGRRYVHRRISGFLDYKRFLDGGPDALKPILEQSQQLNARGRRMFATMVNITDFNPDAYGDRYWGEIPAYFDLNAQYGQEVDVCVLPDTGYRSWPLGKCQDFWARWNQALEPISNKWVSLTNEYDHGGNLVGTPFDYARPGDPLVSQGSAVSDAPPPRPGWNRREFHVQKTFPKIGLCEDMYFNRLGFDADGKQWGLILPTDLSEGPRFSEDTATYTPWLSACLAYQSLAFGDGLTFHCEGGKVSQLLGPNQANCCKTAMDILARAEV